MEVIKVNYIDGNGALIVGKPWEEKLGITGLRNIANGVIEFGAENLKVEPLRELSEISDKKKHIG